MIVTISYEIDFPGLTGDEEHLQAEAEDMASEVLESLLAACGERNWDTGGISTDVYLHATEAFRVDVVKVMLKDGTVQTHRYSVLARGSTLACLATDLDQAGISGEVERLEIV